MATIAERVKRRAADRQADVTVTCKSKRARLVGPDRKGHKTQYIQRQRIHPNNANNISRDYGTDISTSIQNLPPELMAMIFSHLNCQDKVRAACVCSYWRDLIDIPSVWRDFCPTIDVDNLTSKHTKKMHIRKIREVEVHKCISVKNMTTFLQGLPHLKNLSCTCFLPALYPGKKSVPGIKQLLIYCSELNTGVLQSFLQPMVNLQDLSLHCIPDQDILFALQHSKNLVSLLINCNIDGVTFNGSSIGDLNPVSSVKHLILVNMTVEDSGLDFISRAFPQLCTLQLILSSSVTFDGLNKLAKLKQLKSLRIASGDFKHGWIEHLDTELPQLETLILNGCTSISNECLQSISKVPVLRVLKVPIRHQEVEGLHALSQGCSGLHTLLLRFGNQFINRGLHVIKFMQNLQDLTMFQCSVNDDFWRENSKSFSKLRMLSFIECQLLSEQCLPYLSQMVCLEGLLLKECMTLGNESIKHLGKWGIFNALTCITLIEFEIKDDTLVELSKNTPLLKKLVIVSCKNVTNDGLAKAVSNLPQLEVLKTDISARIKRRLKRIRPHLQFYRM